jgi:hypothetical protein
MARWLCWLVLAAALGAPLRNAAHADALTLDYDLVVHTTDVHSIEVPGSPHHEVGVASLRGIAIFDDGRVAQHWYAGSFDFIDGSGAFEGYARWAFEDGSRLDSRYVGKAGAMPGGGIVFEGSHSDVTGTGDYAGVTGQGSFEGRRIDYLEAGGETYQRGRLQLELPDG